MISENGGEVGKDTFEKLGDFKERDWGKKAKHNSSEKALEEKTLDNSEKIRKHT